MNKLADIDFGNLRGFGRIGLEGFTLGSASTKQESIFVLSAILRVVIGTMTVVASIWFLFKIITGGLAIMSAGGEQGKLAEARSSITSGLVGLIIVLTATIILGFIGSILNIEFLNLGSFIENLGQ